MTVPQKRKIHDGPRCKDFGGKNRRTGKPCEQAAGWGTDHPGEGKCKLHGGSVTGRPPETGEYSRYAIINRPRLAELREHFEKDPNPLDLLPEVIELRTRVADFSERYDELTEALLAWHYSFDKGYKAALADWRDKHRDWLADYLERCESGRTPDDDEEEPDEPPLPPLPEDFAQRPRRVIDILQVGKFIVDLSAIADRIVRQKTEGTITMATLDATLERYAVELVRGAEETIEDADLRQAVLANVEDRWNTVVIATDRDSGNSAPRNPGQ